MTPTQPCSAPQPAAGAAWELSETDIYLFNEGTHRGLADKLGAHSMGSAGTVFAVWAPSARSVSVIGDFNRWDRAADPLDPLASSGIWVGVISDAAPGHVYKYAVTTAGGAVLEKADPYAFAAECPPRTGSVVWDLGYEWGDGEWMANRDRSGARDAPVSVYEVHLGSWRRPSDDPTAFLSYEELAPLLIDHVLRTGFTHVEFLPVMEHPFYGSWGYQTTGYFAPTARYGTPQGLMALIDQLHQAGIGILLDWVPSHFPTDAFALGEFDGTHLYEHADPRQGFHPDWTSYIFNYGRNEVRSFLLSSAEHWLSTYHVDGLRVDAVASMLYLDYSRAPGEWIPNRHGGRENLDAIEFLRQLNIGVYGAHPDVQTVAEESTAWPGVSRPTDVGGLGFGYKWDMGWMHDTLEYMRRDPVHRRYHHDQITFRGLYAFTENYILPLSHDEVVHGKGSLLGAMPGDDWQKFANLRLLYGYQYAQPGKKLLFMGDELGQWQEWSHERCLEWHLLDYARHSGLLRWVTDLNRRYREEPALHELDCDPSGFERVEVGDASIDAGLPAALHRRGLDPRGLQLHPSAAPSPDGRGSRRRTVAGDPQQRRQGLRGERHREPGRGGSPCPFHATASPYSLSVTAPPLAVVFLRREHRGRTVTMRVWPGTPHPLGATWDGEGVNFALFSRHATDVQLCIFEHAEDAVPTFTVHDAPGHRLGLVLLPARRPARHPLRLPGRRAVGPRAGTPIQPRQAPHRSLRQGGERTHPLERRDLRAQSRRRGRRPHARPPGLGRVDAEVGGGRPGIHVGGRPRAAHALEPYGHLRVPRPGHDDDAPGGARTPPGHLPGPVHRRHDRSLPRPRDHRRRAHAGAPVRRRPAPGRAGSDQLLGLQHAWPSSRHT